MATAAGPPPVAASSLAAAVTADAGGAGVAWEDGTIVYAGPAAGLPWAFLQAGASAVLAAEGDLDDGEAVAFVRRFLARLDEGFSVTDAAAAAGGGAAAPFLLFF
jgi:hypothetical protein